jgi:multiple sugar transport system substrate-binding protein
VSTSLQLLARSFDGFERALDQQLAGVDVPVTARFLDVHSLQETLIDSDCLTDGSVDLALVLTDWIPRLIADGKLLDISDLAEAGPIEGAPGCWTEALLALQRDAEGRLFGLPYHDGPVMLLYRKDLYQDAREREGFATAHGYALAPPMDWQQFADHASFFNRPAAGLWGTVFAGYPDEHNTVYDFLTQLWSRGGDIYDEAGRLRLISAPALEGLRFLHEMWHERGVVNPDAAHWDSVRSGEEFAAGHAALMVNWCGFAAMSADPDSTTHGQVGCAVAPRALGPGGTSVTMNGYYVMAIARGCNDVPAARRTLEHLASHHSDRTTALSGASAVRRDTWADSDIDALAPYYGQLERAHEYSRSLPRDPRWPEISKVLNAMVFAVICGTQPESALAQADAALAALEGST